jgi:hypothetical protein
MADNLAPVADAATPPVADLKAGVRAILDGWGALLKPVAEANRDKIDPRDKRFAGPEWGHPVFDLMRQGYAIMADAMMSAVEAVPGDANQKARMSFAMRTLVEAMSPANSPLTNPVALDLALETNGASLAAGFQHLMTDLQRGQLTHTAPTAFELGVNIATTPGKVVYETPLYQLIQYAPTTPTVAATPLVIFPPWINRFYILDLSPEKSFIRWAVAEGLTVFMVSWKSADASMADVIWDDYIAAQIAAIDTIRDLLDVKSVHAIGYCVAGTTLAATLAAVPTIPIEALAVLIGIDKFMSECRALTNLVGNGVACLVISKWEGELDEAQLHAALEGSVWPELDAALAAAAAGGAAGGAAAGAGGPLLVSILLSRYGRIGPVVWYLPLAALFLAFGTWAHYEAVFAGLPVAYLVLSRARRERWRRTNWSMATAITMTAPVVKMDHRESTPRNLVVGRS